MKRTLLSLSLAVAALFSSAAFADPQTEAVLNVLKTKYPSTTFTGVRATPMPGIFEVQMGRNLAYTDETGRNFLFGAMYDMQEHADLTASRKTELGIADAPRAAAQKAAPALVKWESLPLKDAFVRVNGNGARKLAIFSDPDCPYCKRLEKELLKVDNVTIYTFLFPIDSLHPDAGSTAQQVWCAGDEKTRGKIWATLLLTGESPASQIKGKVKPVQGSSFTVTKAVESCATPIDRNIALAQSLGVFGTPTLIAADGRRLPGFVSAESVSAFLDATAPAAVAAK